MKTNKPKLITVPHVAIGVNFSPGNPTLVVQENFKPDRLSPRLAKVFARVAKSGRGGVWVKSLNRDDRWSARFLLKIKALREIPEAAEKERSPERKTRREEKASPGGGTEGRRPIPSGASRVKKNLDSGGTEQKRGRGGSLNLLVARHHQHAGVSHFPGDQLADRPDGLSSGIRRDE